MNTVFCRNTKNIIIMDSSYSVLGMGKARPVCRALVGGVRFSVSGWTKCPEVGQGAPHYSTFELFMVDTILLL